MNLTPQHKTIIDFLEGGDWKCVWQAYYIKDDRKRISELNEAHKRGEIDFWIDGIQCDKRCGVKHHSRIFMRKLISAPQDRVIAKTFVSFDEILTQAQQVPLFN